MNTKKLIIIITTIALASLTITGCGDLNEKPLQETADTVHLNKVQKYYDGDWYGWWAVYDPEGSDEFSDGDSWDACARISFDEEGNPTLAIWDEYTSLTDPLGRLGLEINSDYTATSGDGTFLGEAVEKGQWEIKPQDEENPDLLYIAGTFETEEESFDYEICLKKWGETWEDVDEEDRPYNLENWYLPIIDAGGAMPEEITIKKQNQTTSE